MDVLNEELALLIDLLNCPSVNAIDNEKIIAKKIYEYFKNHNINAELQEIDDTHANVIASIKGESNEKTMLWNGHIDTVLYGKLENWSTNPKKAHIIDDKIYARGSSDMKSGLAAMIYALCHLLKKPKYDIVFVATSDEEKTGIGATNFIKKYDIKYDYLVIAEPTNLKLGIMHKGCIWLKCNVKGKTSHGAYPHKGVNAIHCAYEFANELCDYIYTFKNDLLGSATAQIDMINGGIAPNMTADECSLVMDIRPVPELSKTILLNKIDSIINEIKAKKTFLNISYEFLNDRRAFNLDTDDELIKKIEEILHSQGIKNEYIGINYFTDASIIASNKQDAKVLLFGPGNPDLAHQANEYVSIKNYLLSIKIFERLAIYD